MSPKPYQNTHIPGVVFWTFTNLLLPDWRMNLDAIAFEKLMSQSDLTTETTVIAYGSYSGTGGWIFWFLAALVRVILWCYLRHKVSI